MSASFASMHAATAHIRRAMLGQAAASIGRPDILSREVQRPVVFFANGIGDNILNLPALRALADIFSDKLCLVHSDGRHSFLFDELALRRRVSIDVWWDQGERQFDAVHAAGAIADCDLFISLAPWRSNALLSLRKLVAAPVSVGFFEEFDVHVALETDIHSSKLAFKVPGLFDPFISMTPYLDGPKYPIAALQRAAELACAIPEGRKILAVHADTLHPKTWPDGKLSQALNRFLSARADFAAVLVGYTAPQIDLGAAGDRIFLCYGIPLAVSFALVARSDLFLGVDSCMMHAADFARVSSVGLFGPTDAREFGFLVGPNITIQGSGSMDDITIDDVVHALEEASRWPKNSSERRIVRAGTAA